MFRLCLFDLDNTLVHTDDLEYRIDIAVSVLAELIPIWPP